jgi:hypothetical protein
MKNEPIMIKTSDGKIINTKYSNIENYIAQKLQNRQVQID